VVVLVVVDELVPAHARTSFQESHGGDHGSRP
jgi:hypothetical protein